MQATQNLAIDCNYLDQEFNRYALTVKDLLKNLTSADDRRICAHYIAQCHKLKSENIQIKHHRNRYMRFLMKTMKRTVENQNKAHDYFINMPDNVLNLNEKNEMKQWSNDGRTYVAAKIIPGYATLIYMAVTKLPEDGWEPDGFAKFSSYLPEIDIKKVVGKAETNFEKNAEKNE